MLGNMLENVRNKCPLIHNITNYVTVNDCANILLACGGSPIMADDINEVCEITSICGGLNINIGTLNSATIESMLAAGKKANELNHPVLLDPVGAGASSLRTNTAKNIISEVKLTVIRGNISEIKTVAGEISRTSGVDAAVEDAVTENSIDNTISFAKRLAADTGSVIAITGAVDIVADSDKAYVIRNGNPMMSRITGTGCMLSAMTTAYITANPDNITEAVAASVCAMGLCGELAYERLGERDGNSSYRDYIIDEVYNLTAEKLENGAKYEIR
jgi:hydroxyethylthiazole kinase